MAREIKQVSFPAPPAPKLTRVAAYARVSSGKDAMHHSLSAQVSYYSSLIQKHPGWTYAGVYADEAKTGTKDSRANFQRLIADCQQGRIDLVITKSVSRFARNTVTLLETVRQLKDMDVDVYFEEQNIHTMSTDGELMLTILASYAQEESRSVSENQKWRIRKNFKEGRPWNGVMLGYRQQGGKYIIVPEEAEIVRRIYTEYLAGKGLEAIVNGLNADGILTQKGFTWHKGPVSRILRNSNYTGNLLLQRFYSENHITKRKCVNEGELPKYSAADTHEAIIDIETFNAVQAEIERRAKKFTPKPPQQEQYQFTGMIICGKCGKHYRRKVTATGPVWICSTYNSKGKAACPSKQIPEPILTELTADMDICDLTEICAEDGNKLVFHFKNGDKSVKQWQDRSRSESWTPEMRAAAGQRTKERWNHNA